MIRNDEIAIYESYRDDILNKFKEKHLSSDNENSEESSSQNENDSNDESEGEDIDVGDNMEDIDMGDDESDPIEKETVFVKPVGELNITLGSELRSILRSIPEITRDTEILSAIKQAKELYNDGILDKNQHLKMSPMAIFDALTEVGALREEEMDPKDIVDYEKSQGIEPDVLQSFEGDDYREFDDETPDWEKELESEREKDRLREIIRQSGSDWRSDDEDYLSSNY